MPTSTFVPIIHGAALDRPDEADTVIAAEAIAAALCRLGFVTEIIALNFDLSALERLASSKPMAVFNLVEALGGDARLADLPVAVLEHLGIAHTGADLTAYRLSTSKLVSKQVLSHAGLPTPQAWPRGDGAPPGLPVIIKSVDEHASLGIDAASIVDGALASDEVARRQDRFGGQFFAETYIAGREFNVALLHTQTGVAVLPVPEIVFDALPPGRPHIVDYEAKWDSTSDAYHNTPRRFGLNSAEPELAAELSRIARACWAAFDMSGYARVDFRVDASGAPTVLEVNANPCLAPDAGFVAAAAEAGIGYDDVIAAIVAAATLRLEKVA